MDDTVEQNLGKRAVKKVVEKGKTYVREHVVEPQVNGAGKPRNNVIDYGDSTNTFNRDAMRNPDRGERSIVDLLDETRDRIVAYTNEQIIGPEVSADRNRRPGMGDSPFNEKRAGHSDTDARQLLEQTGTAQQLEAWKVRDIDARVAQANEQDKAMAWVRVLTVQAIEKPSQIPSKRAVAQYAKVYVRGVKYSKDDGIFNALGTFNACEALAQVCGKSYEPPTPDREEMSTRELMSRIKTDLNVLAWEVSGAVLSKYVTARDTAQESGGRLDEKFNANSVSYLEIRRWGGLVRAKWRELDTALAMSGYEAEVGNIDKHKPERDPYIKSINNIDDWDAFISEKEGQAEQVLEDKKRNSLKTRFGKMMDKARKGGLRPRGILKVWEDQWVEEEIIKREKKNFGIAVDNEDPMEADNCRRLADRSKAKLGYLNQKQDDILFDDQWKIPFHWLRWKLGRGATRVFENSRLVNEFVEDNAARVGDRIKQSLDLINEENRVRRIESEMISAMRSLQAQFSENNRSLQAVAEELWRKDDDELDDAQEELIAQGLHVPQSTVKLAEAKYGELLHRLIGKGEERRLPVGVVQSV